jgi:hypothetical protein
MNRRMRNRMSGGVGGRQGRPCLLPDWTAKRYLISLMRVVAGTGISADIVAAFVQAASTDNA